MTSMPEPTLEQLVLVSDLHLGGGGRHERFRQDRDFTDFCHHLAGRPPTVAGARRLAVLGDFLELLEVRAGEEGRLASSVTIALARLDRIVDAHAGVFAAVADLVDAGWGIDVVIGNHDIDLIRPALQHRLGELLGKGRRHESPVRFHPWILHVPGLLYAEHGSQYHDINWFPELLWAAGRHGDGPIRHPLGAHLGERPPALVAASVRELANRLLGVRDPRRRRYRCEGLTALSQEVALSREALRRIDLVPATSVGVMALRLLRQLYHRQHGGSIYLRQAARAIDRILQPAGEGCAFYAFGHSHAAEHRRLMDGEGGPEYLNAGTWSLDVRGALRRAPEEDRCTFVVINCFPGNRPTAALHSWSQRKDPISSAIIG